MKQEIKKKNKNPAPDLFDGDVSFSQHDLVQLLVPAGSEHVSEFSLVMSLKSYLVKNPLKVVKGV